MTTLLKSVFFHVAGELVIFTDFVAHAAHQQQCMSLASHQTEFAIDPFEETSVVNKVAYNGFTILGVEHGGLISLLPGLSDTDAHHEQSESPPAKKRRADSIAIGSNVTLAAFSDVYSNAAGCILQGCANMKIYHDNATQQIANQIRAFEVRLIQFENLL